MDWYGPYAERHAADGSEGRPVAMHTFSESWTSWEMHPNGDEVVLCTAGEITLVQELAGDVRRRRWRRRVRDQRARRVAYGGCRRVLHGAVHHGGFGTEHRPR